MSWYRLRIAEKRELLEELAAGRQILDSAAWLDIAAVPTMRGFSSRGSGPGDIPPDFIFAAQILIARELRGQHVAGGLVGEGTFAELLDVLQQVYEAADASAGLARITEELVQRYNLDDDMVVDFREGDFPG